MAITSALQELQNDGEIKCRWDQQSVGDVFGSLVVSSADDVIYWKALNGKLPDQPCVPRLESLRSAYDGVVATCSVESVDMQQCDKLWAAARAVIAYGSLPYKKLLVHSEDMRYLEHHLEVSYEHLKADNEGGELFTDGGNYRRCPRTP